MRTLEEVVEFHNILPIPLPSLLLKDMSKVIINGRSYNIKGSFSIINGRIVIDGKAMSEKELEELSQNTKVINISIDGNLEKLDVDCCETIHVNGNVGKIKTTSGDIDIDGDVSGDVQTVSGDIDCGNIGGDASTVSGDIRRK